MSPESIADILANFFDLLCKCLKQPHSTDPITTQQERDVLALEIVMLFRLLLDPNSGGTIARDSAQKILTSVFEGNHQVKLDLPDSRTISNQKRDEKETDASISLLGAFYILGGQRDVLRVGGKVGLPAKDGNTIGVIQGS